MTPISTREACQVRGDAPPGAKVAVEVDVDGITVLAGRLVPREAAEAVRARREALVGQHPEGERGRITGVEVERSERDDERPAEQEDQEDRGERGAGRVFVYRCVDDHRGDMLQAEGGEPFNPVLGRVGILENRLHHDGNGWGRELTRGDVFHEEAGKVAVGAAGVVAQVSILAFWFKMQWATKTTLLLRAS